MTSSNLEHMGKAVRALKEGMDATKAGTTESQRLDAAMKSVQSASSEIAQILKTIDEIAFQTNILALNAAVEAARAGTAGAGFAVVADEVRNLAQRSSEAAKQSSTRIGGALEQIQVSAQSAAKVAQHLKSIAAGQIQAASDTEEVQASCREQITCVNQVSQALNQFSDQTQKIAMESEQTAASATLLEERIAEVDHGASDIQNLIHGSRSRNESVGDNAEPGFSSAEPPRLASRAPVRQSIRKS
jgi:methyl-accepting chemotaxis protein